MKGFVLDASIALAWCFSDEQTEYTQKLLLGNCLISAERRGRISFADINQFIGLLGELNFKVDGETSNKGFHEILTHAYAQNLTTYDAACLELAMRLGLPLASKDKQLCEVANRLGTKVLPIFSE